MVVEYFDRVMLRKIGYSFDIHDLTTFEADCFRIIAGTLSKEEEKELKRKTSHGRAKNRP